MLGYAVFGSIYGVENISRFAVIDLGQVLFVFFILVTRLEFQQNHRLTIGQTLKQFLKRRSFLESWLGSWQILVGLTRLSPDGRFLQAS